MSTDTTTCSVCQGTGWDDVFNSPCDCGKMANPRFAGGQAFNVPMPATLRCGNVGQGSGSTAPVAATDKQVGFIHKLLSERPNWDEVLDGRLYERCMDVLGGKSISKSDASKVIDALLAFKATPVTPVAKAAAPVTGLDLTPLARYTSKGSVRFGIPGMDTRLKVRIDLPADGKWAGWVFVKDAAEYGQGQRYGSQKPGRRYEGKIEQQLAAILADPAAALAKYGHLTSTCGICGRPLEDEESVARGIGPICYGKL